jgi:hypothetical protein
MLSSSGYWVFSQPEICFGFGRAGLTTYVDPIARTRVLVRLLNLGAIFREFCELIHEEVAELDLDEWADTLGISAVRVGQALGPSSLLDLDTDSVDLATALLELMNEDRPNVCEALVNIFGNESSLFASLFKACDGRQIEEPELDDYFVLNDISPNKMRGFEWITEGMPMLH